MRAARARCACAPFNGSASRPASRWTARSGSFHEVDFDRVGLRPGPGRALRQVRLSRLQDAKSALAAAGVDQYFLALDATFNHVRGSRQRGHWQLHFWGVVLEGASPRIDELKNLINASGSVHKPVQISTAPIRPSSVRAVMAYALKSRFKRRETVMKSRPGKSPFRDPQKRPLLGLPLVELMLFLDRIGLHGRLLTKGVDLENLQRARAIRAARQSAIALGMDQS